MEIDKTTRKHLFNLMRLQGGWNDKNKALASAICEETLKKARLTKVQFNVIAMEFWAHKEFNKKTFTNIDAIGYKKYSYSTLMSLIKKGYIEMVVKPYHCFEANQYRFSDSFLKAIEQ